MKILNQTEIKKMNDSDLYRHCQLVGKNARIWKNRFVALLPEVEKRELYKKKKFHSIYEFAAKLAGLSNNVVEEALRLSRKLEDKPVLKEMISKVGLHKVRVVASIATTENQKDLAEKVQKMSKNALEMFVQDKRKSVLNEQNSSNSHPGMEIKKLSFDVSKDTDFKLRKLRLKYEKKLGEKLSWEQILKILIEKDEEEPKRRNKTKKQVKKVAHKEAKIAKAGLILDAKKKQSRPINAAKKHELEDQYDGKCAFPGCNKPSEENHHPQRYALEQSHENVKPLCKTHHELAHNGMIKNEQMNPEYWKLQDNADKNDPKYRIDLKVQQKRMAHLN